MMSFRCFYMQCLWRDTEFKKRDLERVNLLPAMDPSNLKLAMAAIYKTSALNSLHTCSTFLSSFSSITLSLRHVESGEVQTGNIQYMLKYKGRELDSSESLSVWTQ